MDIKLLSIIIPTYNMEKLLSRCLDSLLIHDYFNLLEVWIVNDGSKDRSSVIAHQYADRYPNVFHVIDKANGNYGSCINTALKVLTGKYVKVLDADDFFDSDALKNIIERLMKAEADIVLTNFTMLDIINNQKHYIDLRLDDNSEIDPANQNTVDYEMHNIIYKTSLLRDNHYIQSEGISYTDTEWTCYPFLYARKIIFFKENLYQYVMGREGQTIGAETFCKHIEMMEFILERIFQFLIEKKSLLTSFRKAHVDYYIQKKIWEVYYNELIRRKHTNYASLKKMDDLCKSYDEQFYYSLQKPKKYYIYLFRQGIYIPIWMRSFNMKMAHWLHSRKTN